MTTVVGVVGDGATTAEGDSEGPEALYVPLSQGSDLGGTFLYLLVRSTEPPAVLSKVVGHEIRALDPDLAMWEPEPMTQVIRRTWVSQAFTGLFGVFAFAATLLACSGLYSMVALDVSRRRREIGIRMALGARPRDIVRLLGRQGLAELAGGFLAGVALAFALARRLSGIFSDRATESALLIGAVGLLAVLGVSALLFPVRSISRSHPAALLHEQREEG